LLAHLGVDFEVVVPEVEELRDGDPAEVVLENARRKAREGWERVTSPRTGGGQVGEGGGLVVLGVDTDVAVDGKLLGKAGTEEEARERLELLSGRAHEVLSGVVVLGIDAESTDSVDNASITAQDAGSVAERSGVATSHVTFKRLDDAILSRYLASGEWQDRAGAYAIQGLGAILVDELRGDFSNVVGLPLSLLLDLAPGVFGEPL
jgi:septum formation protein